MADHAATMRACVRLFGLAARNTPRRRTTLPPPSLTTTTTLRAYCDSLTTAHGTVPLIRRNLGISIKPLNRTPHATMPHHGCLCLQPQRRSQPFSSSAAQQRNFYKNKKKKKNKSKDYNTNDHDLEVSVPSTKQGGGKKRTKKSRRKKNNIQSQQQSRPQILTHGATGRPILTNDMLQQQIDPQIVALNNNMSNNQNAKTLLHNAKYKLLYQTHIRIKLDQGAPNRAPTFVGSYSLTWDADAVLDLQSHLRDNHLPMPLPTRSTRNNDNAKNSSPSQPTKAAPMLDCHIQTDDSTGDWILTGMGRAHSKRHAEMLAAVDVIALLKQELQIDIQTPPNLGVIRQQAALLRAKEQKRAAKQLFKEQVSRAQMMLELLDVSKPQMSVVNQSPTNVNEWIATVTTFCRGTSISAQGRPGQGKAQAEGNSLLALVDHPQLKQLVGQDELDRFQEIVDAAPAKHVSALRVSPLPQDVWDGLGESIGSVQDHQLRMQRHKLATESYESSLQERGGHQVRFNNYPPRKRHPKQVEAINHALLQEEEQRFQKALNNPDGKQGRMKAIRDALPISKIQLALIEALETEQVVVVSGGTGSGKSTQCPQYILEDAIAKGKGADTRVIVTQPRKIAAISVAERVAAERDERIGNSVGYSVRFKRDPPRDVGGSVEFMTTGVLLRRLLNDPTMTGVTHVMIDEVHERDIQTDFLLILLRDLLPKRPDLRVILMSATLDAESFGKYFSMDRNETSPVPVLSVPTEPRHPVAVSYLEDLATGSGEGEGLPLDVQILAQSLLRYNDEKLRTQLEEALAEEKASDRLEILARAEDGGGLLESDSDSDTDSDTESESDLEEESSDEEGDASGFNTALTRRLKALRRAVSIRNEGESTTPSHTGVQQLENKFEASDVIVALVVKVARHLAQLEKDAGRSGSILCFLPGWDEIKEATEQLESETNKELLNQMKILPLHSTIPQDDQQKVFEPANGSIKVILSTNIAESSVTINDVLAVVDSGLVRELNFDAESAMSAMETNQTARTSCTQRLGRAGRVAPGRCYRIYSRGDLEAMAERPTPEIQRTALEATCLQTCNMTSDGVERFLSRALDPPPQDAVSFAMDRLIKLGAINKLEQGESLTPLGRCLSRFPLDPATGRMLIMGVVNKCLDPLLTSAACFSSRNTFYNPPGMRDEAQEIRRSFSNTSDIMATVQAYDKFWSIVEDDGWQEAKDWAYSNYVSIAAMTSIQAVRMQLLRELNKIGLVPNSDLERLGRRKAVLRHDASVNQNSDVALLYSAIWATAFPGNLAARRQLGTFGTLRTRMEDHAGLHPSSVGFFRKPPGRSVHLPAWYLYREMVLSSSLFIRGCTGMTPEQILLFGGYSMRRVGPQESQQPSIDNRGLASGVDNDGDNVLMAEFASGLVSSVSPPSRVRGVLDGWIVVEGRDEDTLDLLLTARDELNAALEHKVMYPKADLPQDSQSILDDIANMYNLMGDDGGSGKDDSLRTFR